MKVYAPLAAFLLFLAKNSGYLESAITIFAIDF
jgi:hypothetical protein